MRIPRHWLFITGAAAFIASIAMIGISMGAPTSTVVAVGDFTTEPTIDPCLVTTNFEGVNTGVNALVQQPICVTATRRPAFTHTPTPEPTDAPTEPPSTDTPAPTTAPATNTPTGGAEGGGVRPPNTGTGGGHDTNYGMWLLVLGAALAATGVGATAAGFRSR